MKKLAMAMAAAGLAATGAWAGMQDRAKLTQADQVRFVFFAVLEGLHEDGVERGVADAIVAAPDPGYFVVKCPICHPVRAAFASYVPATGPYMEKVRREGLPKETLEALKSKDRDTRLRGIAAAVDRWMQRRFDLVNMPESERQEMRRLLKEGMKLGMSVKPPDFGDYCPSCDGANGVQH